MNEEYFDQPQKSANDSKESNPSNSTLGGRPATGRPRIRRHIMKAEKVTPNYNYNPAQKRTNSYQPRERYNQQSYNNRNNNQDVMYSPRERYNQREEGGYHRNAYQPHPTQQSTERFNRVDASYKESYSRPAEGGYNNNYQRTPSGPRQQQPKPKMKPQKTIKPKYSQKKILRYKEQVNDPTQPLRLNKFMANAGICSRRDADKYIEAGLVTVNGVVVTELGTKIQRTDDVRFHGEPVRLEDKIYILLNKPKDYVTTSDDPLNRKTVMDLVKNACPERIYPIGRLDRNTTGVLLLTNDGDMASKLMHPKYLKKKIYHVFLNKNVSIEAMQKIISGIELEDGVIKADAIDYASDTDKKQVGIEIHSGKNRIVRRIFESLGYHVMKLDRVYFAGLTKKNLRRGDWRFLTEDEVRILRMGAYE